MVCEVKCMQKSLIKDSIKETITVVMLDGHENKLSKELSGGMKRKLCLAMAIGKIFSNSNNFI